MGSRQRGIAPAVDAVAMYRLLRGRHIAVFFFFLNDPAPTEIYPLPLHDALPTPAPPLPAHVRQRPPDEPHRREEVQLEGGDRKSTRLNSSHLVISYAVFCLKKKKS